MDMKKETPVLSGGGLNTDSGEYTQAYPDYTISIEKPIQTEYSGSENSAATVDELTTAPDASCMVGNPSGGSGNVTVLVCERDKSATKTIKLGEDGVLFAEPFTAGGWFNVRIEDCADIYGLSQLLSSLENNSRAMIIRGEPLPEVDLERRVRRTKHETALQKAYFQSASAGRRWVWIDFDKIALPPDWDLVSDPIPAVNYLVSLLPPEFRNVSYHWQLSSSAGWKNPGLISAHLAFWLDRPWHDDELNAWAKAWNAKCGFQLIDPRPFNAVQPHYVAAPNFDDGAIDPLPQRSGFVEKASDEVALVRIESDAAKPKPKRAPPQSQTNSCSESAELDPEATGSDADLARVKTALRYISADDRELWITIGLALKHTFGERALSEWLKWSAASAKYDEAQARADWASFEKPASGAVGLGTIFHYAKEGGWEDTPDWVHELNQIYFVAPFGGKTCVLRESYDKALKRERLETSSFADFKNLFSHQLVVVGSDRNGNPRYMARGKAWLQQARRRQYDGIVFEPNADSQDQYNLWRGFGVKSAQGDWSAFQEHLLEVMCGGNRRHYDYLIGWMARAVQQPEKQGEVAVVFRGGRGTGKSVSAKYFGKLFGRHFVTVSNTRHLTGNFNRHLHDCVLLFADEAFWAGDKQGENVLKALITEPTLTIEPKGKDLLTANNCLHIMMASNNEWVVPAGSRERRFFVLDVSDKRQQDTDYFRALDEQMVGGGLSAMLHDLLQYDLSKFEVRSVPQTEALVDQKLRGLTPVQSWWLQKLEKGVLLDGRAEVKLENGAVLDKKPGASWDDPVEKQKLWLDCQEFARASGISNRRTDSAFALDFKPLLPNGLPVEIRSENAEGKRVRHWLFPELEQCRRHFAQLFGLSPEYFLEERD
jgi:Primase C terminal 2 (PriCT-2)/Family of unknown function (DUF5906)